MYLNVREPLSSEIGNPHAHCGAPSFVSFLPLPVIPLHILKNVGDCQRRRREHLAQTPLKADTRCQSRSDTVPAPTIKGEKMRSPCRLN